MLCLRHRRIVLAINMDPKIFASVRLVHLESRSRHIIFFGLTGDAARSPGPGRWSFVYIGGLLNLLVMFRLPNLK